MIIVNIDIICPLYNASSYLLNLYNNLINQKKVNINKILFLLTESTDNTLDILNENNFNYELIKKVEFSHSLTREKYALMSDSDIIVFITQDIIPKDDNWLYELVNPIINKEAEATYSRQITKYNNIEKYTREFNYPLYDILKSKNSINEMGLKTFFTSDASAAIKTSIFKQINGYDHKKLVINEDMYLAYKLIMNNYKIKYCSKSVIYHSHKFTLKQLYNRYYDTGVFMKNNPLIKKYGIVKSGGGMAKYILKRAIKEVNFKVLFSFIPNMLARYLGMKAGEKNG